MHSTDFTNDLVGEGAALGVMILLIERQNGPGRGRRNLLGFLGGLLRSILEFRVPGVGTESGKQVDGLDCFAWGEGRWGHGRSAGGRAGAVGGHRC